MICGIKISFEPTTNFMWTYKVTHLKWPGNRGSNSSGRVGLGRVDIRPSQSLAWFFRA